MSVKVIGDIAKHVLQVHGSRREREGLMREQVTNFLQALLAVWWRWGDQRCSLLGPNNWNIRP
jgi:hypothetical protein